MCSALDSPRADAYLGERRRMVEEQLRSRGITAEAVLAAMRTVPRHEFVPPSLRGEAYADHALQLGPRQTISQPYVVALMTQLVAPHPGERVLEIGTGSGYQAAVLAEIAGLVFTIEANEELHARATETLRRLCYRNVRTRCSDGRTGWPEEAPFGAIVVTACAGSVPRPLLEQLVPGGRLAMPIGPERETQMLRLYTKGDGDRLTRRDVTPVRFVPLE